MGDSSSDDEYGPVIGAWGDQANVDGWRALADPQAKVGPGGLGSGNLHRKGRNFKPIDENYILQQRLKGAPLSKSSNKTSRPSRGSAHRKPASQRQQASPIVHQTPIASTVHSADPWDQPQSETLARQRSLQHSHTRPTPMRPQLQAQPKVDFAQEEYAKIELQSRKQKPKQVPTSAPNPRRKDSQVESLIQPLMQVSLHPKPPHHPRSSQPQPTTSSTGQQQTSWIPPAHRNNAPMLRPSKQSGWTGKPLVDTPFWESSSPQYDREPPSSWSVPSPSSAQRFSIPNKSKFSRPVDNTPRPSNYRDQPQKPKTIAPPPIADNPILVTIQVALNDKVKIPVHIRLHDDPDAMAATFSRDHQITSPVITHALRDLFHSQKAQSIRKQRNMVRERVTFLQRDQPITSPPLRGFPRRATRQTHLMSSSPLRSQVIALYKQLVYLGREYPAGYEHFFRPKLKAAFMKKRDMTNEADIKKAIEHGDYIVKELEMMYYLRKYRTLRKRYVEQ